MLFSDSNAQRYDNLTYKLRLILACPASDDLNRCGGAGALPGVSHVFTIILPFTTKTT
jgi:hypothetical protein